MSFNPRPAALPPVTIVMTTWMPDSAVGVSRRDSASLALVSWGKYLHYEGPLGLHVADDGSHLDGGVVHLLRLAKLGTYEMVSDTRQERHGVGASLNAGCQYAFDHGSPIVLYAVDDWALTGPLDITPWVRTLLTQESIGMVRLGPPHPDMTGTVQMVPEGWVLRLDRHHFVNGLRPFLMHERFWDVYGPYDEDESSLETERKANLRFCHWQATGGPDVVLALPHPWEHVGQVELSAIDPRADADAGAKREVAA